MDNTNTSNTIWQWRIVHMEKYSRRQDPFYHSNRIGMDFNVGLHTKKKLDLRYLTNAVVLEVLAFAKTVNKGKGQFITNILENNFDLGLKNVQQRTEFIARISQKVKDLIKKTAKVKQEVFPLFDTSSYPESDMKRNVEPNGASIKHKTEDLLMEQDDADCEHKDELKSSEEASEENMETESLSGERSADDSERNELKSSKAQSAEEWKDDLLPSFPYCKEIGLSLDIGAKQSLDPGLLTNGAMLELVHFTRVLTSSNRPLVLDVLEHNFDLDRQSGLEKSAIWDKILCLLDKRKWPQDKLKQDFIYKPLFYQTEPLKRSEGPVPASDGATQNQCEEVSERSKPEKGDTFCTKEKVSMETHYDSLCMDLHTHPTEGDHDHMCPQKESDLDLVEVTNAGHPGNEELSGGEMLTQAQVTGLNECEMGTEESLWKCRANCIKNILKPPNKMYWSFKWSKAVGLDFNVGFGLRKNLSVKSLTRAVLLEVAKFALAINSSQQDFIMEILEHNFDLDLQNEHLKNTFAHEVMNAVTRLKHCENDSRLSNETFEIPVPLSSFTKSSKNLESVNHDVSSTSRMDCDASPTCSAHAERNEPTSRTSGDRYPFCEKIGLRLLIYNSQLNKKLDKRTLTKGAIREVAQFAGRLCGTFEEIFLGIIRHNCDLDFPSVDSDPEKEILLQIQFLTEQKNLLSNVKTKKNVRRPVHVVLTEDTLDCHNNPNLDSSSRESPQAPITGPNVGNPTDIDQKDLEQKLWELRANQIQQLLSMPHEEHCPLYSYSRCKKIGIDFNVGSDIKSYLDPKLLTNGIMVELNTLATALQSAQMLFTTEILEYNFDLSFNNELCRFNFAEETIYNVRQFNIIRRNLRPRMKRPFKLPDTICNKLSYYAKNMYCPRCYKHRNDMFQQNQSDPGYRNSPQSHVLIDAVSADSNCSQKKHATDPPTDFPTVEERIMDGYPRCKEIGLSLCVNKSQPKDKLSTYVLTLGIMFEVVHFAKRLCGTKNKIINEILEHNFKTGIQSSDINPAIQFSLMVKKSKPLAWFNDIFIIQPSYHGKPRGIKQLQAIAAAQKERKEATKKRKLALQERKERVRLPNLGIANSKNTHSICADLDGYQREGEPDFTCPLEESDLGSFEETDSGNPRDQDDSQLLTFSSNVFGQSDSSFLGTSQRVPGTNDGSAIVHGSSSSVGLAFPRNSDNGELSGSETKTQTPTIMMDEHEVETGNNMWKCRANCVKKILTQLDKTYCHFFWSRRVGLEYNIGYGKKQNLTAESLSRSLLLEVAQFTLAINSSQQDFIMEIFKHNFDLDLQNEYLKNTFAHEVMNAVRKLKFCKDVFRFSNETFEIPVPVSSFTKSSQSLSSTSTMDCNVASTGCPDSRAGPNEPIPQRGGDHYPFCEEIGLRLHIHNSLLYKKLDIRTLTKGAMREVTQFAEKLCGTFEEIFLDIIRHNCDLDLPNGDSDPAREVLLQIPILTQPAFLPCCLRVNKPIRRPFNIILTEETLDCQNNANLDVSIRESSQAPVIGPNVDGSIDTEHQNEPEKTLWRLRGYHIQKILSMPHEEHCPLYHYCRSKTIGIDFNVGSGVKKNLDPKLLTNGIMIELNSFATALQTAQMLFITEILEYNFHLNFDNELHRLSFAEETTDKVKMWNAVRKNRKTRNKRRFELPDTRCRNISAYAKMMYCPKCHQHRNDQILCNELDPSDRNHPHTHALTDTGPNRTPPLTDSMTAFQQIEERIMDGYPLCKEMGIRLCVNKSRPKDRLSTHILTLGIINEVAHFAKRLCGASKNKIINDVLEHNFNFGFQSGDINPAYQFNLVSRKNNGWVDWFNNVFTVQSFPHKGHQDVAQLIAAASERKETTRKRKMALQEQKEGARLQRPNVGFTKPKKKSGTKATYPACQRIGLDLDVTSKSVEKEKLDLRLLTRAVAYEIYTFATKRVGQYLPRSVYDILDYNFDISSQYHRHWEFSLAASSKVKVEAIDYRRKRDRADEVLELPFEFHFKRKKRQKRRVQKGATSHLEESDVITEDKGRCVRQLRFCLDEGRIRFLDVVNTDEMAWLNDDGRSSLNASEAPVQDRGRTVKAESCQEIKEIKVEEFDPHYGDIIPEPDTDPHCGDVKTETNTEDICKYVVVGEPAGASGCNVVTLCLISEGSMQAQEAVCDVQYCILPQPPGSEGYATQSGSQTAEIFYFTQ